MWCTFFSQMYGMPSTESFLVEEGDYMGFHSTNTAPPPKIHVDYRNNAPQGKQFDADYYCISMWLSWKSFQLMIQKSKVWPFTIWMQAEAGWKEVCTTHLHLTSCENRTPDYFDLESSVTWSHTPIYVSLDSRRRHFISRVVFDLPTCDLGNYQQQDRPVWLICNVTPSHG